MKYSNSELDTTYVKVYGPCLWMGFNCLKTRATSRRQFTFYQWVPRNSWYSFYRPRNDERLSQPWSQPVVLNTGPLDWESIALTNRSLLQKIRRYRKSANIWLNLTHNNNPSPPTNLCWKNRHRFHSSRPNQTVRNF